MESRRNKTPAQHAELLWPHMTQLLLGVVGVEPVEDPVFCYIRFTGKLGHTYLWAAPDIPHRDAVLRRMLEKLEE